MLVLGIDPGTANTGYGVVRGGGPGFPVLVECGVIRTRARDPLPARLREIFAGVQELIEKHRPDALSVEDVFYARNVRTTVVLGHARGVILLAAELAFLVLLGIGVGTALGVFASRLFVPFLQIGSSAQSQYPPFQIEIAWLSIAQIYVLFALLFVAALAALSSLLVRMKIFQAIKLGETT